MTTDTHDIADTRYMRHALRLARFGLGNVYPNPAVGCVLVRAGDVVGLGWTQPGGRPHAETVALAQAGEGARGATAYVTLEPCAHHGKTPPCAEAIIAAGISRCVVATQDPDPRVSGRGVEMLQAAGVDVALGVLADDASELNAGFFLRITENRPLFTLKLATDAQGRIPAPGALDPWITSPLARQRGQLLRAQHDAVLFGIGTALADDPEYTCRLPGMATQSPIRILLDSHGRLPANSRLLATASVDAPLWIVRAPDAQQSTIDNAPGVEVMVAPNRDPDGRVDLHGLAEMLAARGLTRVLVETGPQLASAFLRTELVDRVAWFRAHASLGASGVPAFDPKIQGGPHDPIAFTRKDVVQAGPDTLETYWRN